MQHLQPLTLPLNTVSLIEASAGTGKTHTIASLYLRLLLKIGDNPFERPLNVDEILVVTFTKMATEELKGRIRERIHALKTALITLQTTKDPRPFQNDDFLYQCIQAILNQQRLNEAIARLTLAEQDFDLSAIFTIHSFCQRMLARYAFDSGLPFDIEMQEESEDKAMKMRIVKETWREYFYPVSQNVAEFVQKHFVSPDYIGDKLRAFLGKTLAVNFSHPPRLTESFPTFLSRLDEEEQTFWHKQQIFKANWQKECHVLQALFAEKGQDIKRYTDGSGYKKYFQAMWDWANSPLQCLSPPALEKYFTLSALKKNIKKGASPFSHPLCDLSEAYLSEEQAYQENNRYNKDLLTYHFLHVVSIKLHALKRQQKEKSFDDLLALMANALQSERQEAFARLIRTQYPFAMIDEFQDTDAQQYAIFKKIYLCENPQPHCGFLMIGDPKQSIYKFRGADIFSYLSAAEQAKQRFSLSKNWRANANLITCINALFHFPDNAPLPSFIYPQIQFHPVEAGKPSQDFFLCDKKAPAMQVYLTRSEGKVPTNADYAQVCALSIHQWLAEQNNANVAGKPLEAKQIAVLVRNGNQALLVQQALREKGIHAVYLSEKNDVFQSEIAKGLRFFLRACLNPSNEKNILNALSQPLFFLNLQEIDALKQNEHLWEKQIQDFLHYQKRWQQQGILAMLHYFLQQDTRVQQGLQQIKGERQLTDFLHLAELLQQASRLYENESALFHWYEKQLDSPQHLKTAELRLESDRDLVKIVTIHKSKGLAYDLVWLPFLSNGIKISQQIINTYYDENHQQVMWDMEHCHQENILQESLAEEMRLLYVALTRAKYQVAMVLPETFKKTDNQSLAWQGLWFALSKGQRLPTQKDEQAVLPLLQQWQDCVGEENLSINWADNLLCDTPLQHSIQQTALSLANFHGKIEQHWRISSFSQLQQDTLSTTHNAYPLFFQDEKDVSLPSILTDEISPYPPFHFPKGQRFGIALHEFLEKIDFQSFDASQENWISSLQGLAQKIGGRLFAENPCFLADLAKWIDDILKTPLHPDLSFCLKDIPLKDRLNELPFFFRLPKQVDEIKFNHLLAKYHTLPSLALKQPILKGLMHGFIDLVFRYQDQYYLIDYKSHFLGNNLCDYRGEALSNKIQEQHYDWQYLIYCIALHRHLKNRLADYQYERDFGGVMYLFLRGMNGEAGQGIYFDKPNPLLIEMLEKLLLC